MSMAWLQAAMNMAWGTLLDPLWAWLQVVIPGVSIILISWSLPKVVRRAKRLYDDRLFRDRSLCQHGNGELIFGSRPIPVDDRHGEYYAADIWLSAGVSEVGYTRTDGHAEFRAPYIRRMNDISIRGRIRERWWRFRKRTFDHAYVELLQFSRNTGDQTEFYWKEEIYLPGRYRIELPFVEFKTFGKRRDKVEELRPCKGNKYRRVSTFTSNRPGFRDDETVPTFAPPSVTSGWFSKEE